LVLLPCAPLVVTGSVPVIVTTGTRPWPRSGAASKASCNASMAEITTLAVEANSRTPPSSFSA
jgi:hypothetical protein